MDSLEKNMIGKFSIREILEAFLEAGRWSSFPGSSRAIREESYVNNSMLEDPVFLVFLPNLLAVSMATISNLLNKFS